MKTNALRTIAFAAAAAVLAAAGSAAAHHSTAMFKWGEESTLTGTVEQFEWTNPHVWTWFQVPNGKGGMDRYGLEGMSPNYLGRSGWDKHSLKPGDKIKVGYYPLKDGRKGGFMVSATMPDGKTIRQLPSRAPASAVEAPR